MRPNIQDIEDKELRDALQDLQDYMDIYIATVELENADNIH